MYKNDVPKIIKLNARAGSAFPVGVFTLLTIQSSLSSVGGQINKLRTEGLSANCLWGKKKEGYEYLQQYGEDLHSVLVNKNNSLVDVLKVCSEVPGIGLVKAGFIAQMYGWDVACIDVHNAKRLGLPQSSLRLPKTDKGKAKAFYEYIQLCQQKGSEYWWDTWCSSVSGNRHNKTLKTPSSVSRYHTLCVEKLLDLR